MSLSHSGAHTMQDHAAVPTGPLAGGIEAARGDVRRAASRIEDTFLVAGEALGNALTVIDGAVAAIDAIPRTLADGDMRQAGRALQQLADDLTAVVEALPRERQALADIAERLEALRAPLERLVTSIRTIAILARSARVETAYLSSNQLNFTEFAAEILTLADEAREGINVFVRDFNVLSRLLTSAREAQAVFDTTRRDQISAGVAALQSAFHAIEERQGEAVQVSRQLAERSQRIAGMVGDCIMSLQAGDSTRQRLEHVDTALAEALSADGPEEELKGACLLQAAQLTDAIDEFSQATGQITSGLAGLAHETDGVIDLGGTLAGRRGHGTNAEQDLREQLRQRLSVAATLIHECEGARSSVDGVMASLTGTLQTFRTGLGALQGISRSITTVGLNAAIKSFRIGTDGRGLAVISQDLRTYAEQIVDDTRGLISVFEEVIAAADTIDRGRHGNDTGRMSGADAGIAGIMRTIEASDTQIAEAFEQMARSAGQIGGFVRRAEDALVDLAADMARAGSAAAGLARIGEGGRLARPGEDRYTMKREREIQERLMRA
ncbi:methyl-accepting chemotaxis protein [uncultured Alsobacter sp.]|uniref:methyl-accepting chemotaxis protein n=1 Tax=uncultured Alsobacter sp. TaxID=1748258 RepID=UPI0025EBC490|nr:methyl-accepting chemotaxis protein [uncultured Alsobacter sp.]